MTIGSYCNDLELTEQRRANETKRHDVKVQDAMSQPAVSALCRKFDSAVQLFHFYSSCMVWHVTVVLSRVQTISQTKI